MNIKEKFIKSLEEGYKNYLSIHTRSNKKIMPIHKAISEIILQKLSEKMSGFSVKSMGIDDNKEFKFEGKYYAKDIDITILYKNIPISGLGFKFITSNYKQNSNNYFENMLGETANLKREDFLYGQMIIFKHKMPYYSSDKKTFTKIEVIDENNIVKYFKLYKDNLSCLYHKPDIIYISFIETGDENEFEKIVNAYQTKKSIKIDKKEFHKNQINNIKVKFIKSDNLKVNFSKETLKFIENVDNFEKFIDAFVNLTIGKTYGK